MRVLILIDIPISKEAAILLYYGIISNSINLKASITDKRDGDMENWLEEHGCDMGQGYWFSRPLPLDQLLDFMQKKSKKFAKVVDSGNNLLYNIRCDILCTY